MTKKIAVLAGDGIGPEIVAEAVAKRDPPIAVHYQGHPWNFG